MKDEYENRIEQYTKQIGDLEAAKETLLNDKKMLLKREEEKKIESDEKLKN